MFGEFRTSARACTCRSKRIGSRAGPHEPQVRHGPLHDACGRPPRRPPRHCPVHGLIVGFPGETEEQFQETLDAVRAVNFMSSFSFCYSDRPGTAASRHTDKVEPAEKLRRLERLQALQEDLSSDWLKARVAVKRIFCLKGQAANRTAKMPPLKAGKDATRGATPSTSPCLPESANPASLCPSLL